MVNVLKLIDETNVKLETKLFNHIYNSGDFLMIFLMTDEEFP